MNTFPRLATAAAVIVAAISLGAQPVPVQDLFRGYSHNQISMSPDGRVLATVFPHSKDGDLVTLGLAASDLQTGQSRILHREKDYSVFNLEWVADDRLLVSIYGRFAVRVSSSLAPGYQTIGIYGVSTDGGALKEIVKPGESPRMLGAQFIAPAPEGKGEVLVGVPRLGDRWEKRGVAKERWTPGAYRLNTVTGEDTLILPDPGWTTRWFADGAGKLRVAFGYDKAGFNANGVPINRAELSARRIYWLQDDGATRDLAQIKLGEEEEFAPLGFDVAGEKFLFFGRQGENFAALYAYNPVTDAVEGPLVQSDRVDLRRAVVSPYDNTVVGLSVDDGMGRYEWLHPELRKIAPVVDKALPQFRNRFVGWSRDFQRLLIRSHSATEPGRYFIYDRAKNSINEIYRSAEWMKGVALGTTEAVEVAARDGVPLHGYLTRPPGAPAGRPLPLVLLVHGGPWSIRDDASFDPEVQFFATRGYAVLRVNFRGSGGYGRKFEELAKRQFGGTMQTDLDDAVEHAVAQGWADPKRLVIAGASYGGYATLMGLVQRPERFRAGVALFPVTDLVKQIKDYKALDRHGDRLVAYSWWRQWVGDPEVDEAALNTVSPVRHVSKLRAPVFIVYGEDDDRIQYEQSSAFVKALQAQKKRYERFAPAAEGHGLYREENRYKVYGALEKFLAKHVPVK